MSLILSIFPGLGVLDMGFEEAGFCVVKGPDVIWGGDIRSFHPPEGHFMGIIGGDPCQSHSALANLVRAKGFEPSFPDLTGEFARVVAEAQPRWFLRENVPKAPDLKPHGYEVTSFLLCNSWLGEEQMRKRKFWFGWPQDRGPAPNLRRWIPGVALELPDQALTVNTAHDHFDFRPRTGTVHAGQSAFGHGRTQSLCGDAPRVPVRLGGSGKLKKSAPVGHGRTPHQRDRGEPAGRYTLEEMLELQGLPADLFEHSPFTMEGKRKLVGNAVALPVARAIAQAVKKALE